jgi:RNA polymerase sigma factor (sigma-70 family)
MEPLSIGTSNMPISGKFNINEVIQSYGKRLDAFIRKRVKRAEDADDILQEVFFQLAEADRLLKPIDHLTAWLFTVARNRITDLYRKKKTVSLPEYPEDIAEDMQALNDLLFDDGGTPETEFLRSVFWDELEKALDELPPEQREVFEMTELQGLSFKEIASITGEPVNTLISRKRYAILHLRRWFQLFYEEFINF